MPTRIKDKEAGTADAEPRSEPTVEVVQIPLAQYNQLVAQGLIEKEKQSSREWIQRREPAGQREAARSMAIVQYLADELGKLGDETLELLGKVIHRGHLEELLHAYKEIASGAVPTAEIAPLVPEKPPNDETYAERADKSESAPVFIERVYKDWLTGEFTRADLRRIDPKAEMALRNWEKKYGRASINLPTLKERYDRITPTLDQPKPEEVKAWDRARMRQSRSKRAELKS
ncbi:hypothetical protein [Roseomonas populi]|uniref:Tail assembly chaperone n=1 Tax=Roseomonas populi TaxID=3121582 RepID=A0ABT1X168_9PROT|nr:hypothetical protein [Roseomonas pecuniae]MCR0981848.1 hypothetical protein [Roseomonas pecuniae]